MSRRKKEDNGALFVIIIIIAAIIILAPAIIIIILIHQLFQRSKQQVTHYEIASIWLNTNEKIQFIRCYETYTCLNEKVTDVHQLARDKQISINKDGSYSKRSNLGKEICSILDIYEPKLHNAENELSYLTSLPWERWNNFNKISIKIKSCYLALITWLISYTIICNHHQYPIVSTFTNYITFQSDQHMVFILSGIVSVISFFISYYGMILLKVNPSGIETPSPVNLDNYDTY